MIVAPAHHDLSRLGSLYRSSTAARSPLRIGLLLDGVRCPRFVARIIDDVVSSDFARLELVVYQAAVALSSAPRAPLPVRLFRVLRNAQTRRLLLYSLYTRLDEKRLAGDGDPLAEVDCRALLSGVEAREVEPIAKGFTHRFASDDLARIRGKHLDVLLRFGFNVLRGEILQAARYGVWSFHHGDNDHYRGGPSHFWELYEGNPVSGVTLQVLTEELDGGLVLCKTLFATTPGLSLARNRYGPYWGSTHLMIQKLHELHAHGWEQVESRAAASAPYRGQRRIYKRPTNVEMARWLAPAVLRKIARRSVRAPRLPHWRVAIRTGRPPVHGGGGADMRGFAWIEAPRGHFYADPFLIERDGKTWLFFEDFLYAESRGVISCAEVLPGGSLGPVRRSLERDYHLSYPMVFEDGGDVFMIPESIANGTVELYRATAFPERWRLEKVLRRLPAVDTTVWRDDDRWWFFAAVPEPEGHCATLLLFHAASLMGDWISHPANPISTDVRRARGAGAIFRVQGRRFRPSQDGTHGYGRSFTLNEIVTLTPERYHECAALTVEPSWSKDLVGTHTYNQWGAVEVVDGCTLVHPSSVR